MGVLGVIDIREVVEMGGMEKRLNCIIREDEGSLGRDVR